MSQPNKNKVARGWAELLLRRTPCTSLESEEALVPGDYYLVGGPLPLAEFHGPFEIYDHFSRDFEDHPGMPRNLEQFDIINVFTTAPTVGQRAFLLADHRRHRHLLYKGCLFHYTKSHPLSLIPLRRAFASLIRV